MEKCIICLSQTKKSNLLKVCNNCNLYSHHKCWNQYVKHNKLDKVSTVMLDVIFDDDICIDKSYFRVPLFIKCPHCRTYNANTYNNMTRSKTKLARNIIFIFNTTLIYNLIKSINKRIDNISSSLINDCLDVKVCSQILNSNEQMTSIENLQVSPTSRTMTLLKKYKYNKTKFKINLKKYIKILKQDYLSKKEYLIPGEFTSGRSGESSRRSFSVTQIYNTRSCNIISEHLLYFLTSLINILKNNKKIYNKFNLGKQFKNTVFTNLNETNITKKFNSIQKQKFEKEISDYKYLKTLVKIIISG